MPGTGETGKPLRDCRYVVFGIARNISTFHKVMPVQGSSRVGDPSDYLRTLMPQLTRLNAFDWIEPDVWKKIRGSRPAIKFRAARTISCQYKTVRAQGGFLLGRILDLRKPKMSVSDITSRG